MTFEISKLIIEKNDIFGNFDFDSYFYDNNKQDTIYIKTNNFNIESENEIKFKIFDDIHSINIKSNLIELIVKIPLVENIVSINKIILSNKIKKYLINIFIYVEGSNIIFDNTNKIIIKSNLNNFTKDLEISLIFNSTALNDIMNQNIIVNYSCVNLKKKIKYC